MSKRLPKWLRDTPAHQRATRLTYLHATLKELRQVEHGWDAKSGYRLDRLEKLSSAQVKKLTAHGAEMHTLKARAHVLYRPRSPKTKATIAKHIGRRVTKQTKAVIVQTTLAKSRVRVKHGKVQTYTKVVSKKTGKEHIRVERNYYFMFKRAPRDWDDFLVQVHKTVRTLPKGVYSIISSRFDLVGVPMQRENIMLNMQRWFDVYAGQANKADMAETLIGLRWVGYDHKQSDAFYKRYGELTAQSNALQDKITRREKARVKRRLSKRQLIRGR